MSMPFRAWFNNLMLPCFGLDEDLSDESDSRDEPHGLDSSAASYELDSLLRHRPVSKISNRLAQQVSENGYNSSNSSETSFVCELPDSVIHEILLKLPIKSLIRHSTVCKGWYQLILGNYFADKYYNTNPSAAILISQARSCSNPGPDGDQKFESGRKSEISHISISRKALTFPVLEKTEAGSWRSVVGSCNGLLCVVETQRLSRSLSTDIRRICKLLKLKQTVWIVNPLIEEYTALPKLVHGANFVTHMFGSTENGDQCKVIRVAVDRFGFQCVTEAHVFTIGVDEKWRPLYLSSLPRLLDLRGVILNGVVYWIALGEPTSAIFALNIGEEKGHSLAFPGEVGQHKACNIRFGVWDNRLCIIDRTDQLQFDIWTMKQYGVRESWSRHIVIRCSILQNYDLVPITTMHNGDLLLYLSDRQTRMEEAKFVVSNFLFGYSCAVRVLTPDDIILVTE